MRLPRLMPSPRSARVWPTRLAYERKIKRLAVFDPLLLPLLEEVEGALPLLPAFPVLSAKDLQLLHSLRPNDRP
jgi:hypothetical protein